MSEEIGKWPTAEILARLDAEGVPGVMNLPEVLWAFLEHRQEVLVRRSKYRLGKINHRLEILDGYLIAYLNLDKVIKSHDQYIQKLNG